MRLLPLPLSCLAFFLLLARTASAQVPQTLSYQGFLEDNNAPLTAVVTLTFSLWTHPTSTNPVDNVWSETHPGVMVTDGLYSVSLGSITSFASQSVDFSVGYWLEIVVDEGASSVTLSPRSTMQAVPYAFHAMNAGVGNKVWLLGGNAGTVEGADILGTTDQAALEVWVNGERAYRFEPTTLFDASNVIGGHPDNGAAGTMGATISGGGFDDGSTSLPNTVTGDYGTVGGGRGNTAHTSASVGGGQFNASLGEGSTVAGGQNNDASGDNTMVGGGTDNTANSDFGMIGGGQHNIVSATFGTIGGGGSLTPTEGNRVTDEGGTIGGGKSNQAGDDAGTPQDAWFATVGGGSHNAALGIYTTVSGGQYNKATNWNATVGGGYFNIADGLMATVGGGSSNDALGSYATVAGGVANDAHTFGAFVGGGNDNDATASAATIAGGQYNKATNIYATIPGGLSNDAMGAVSFAAGRRAKANHDGSFVWGDYTDADIASTGINQFVARASGGVLFYSNSTATTGVHLSAGAGSWTSASSAHLKTDFEEIDPGDILAKVVALPVWRWRYKAEAENLRHLGPTAQEFFAAFELGATEEGIMGVDADGVALAAIKGLHALLEEKETQIQALQQQLENLQAQLSMLVQERQP